jgi:hypothetical protein
MKENSKVINRAAKENITGQMAIDTKENLKMA